VAQREQLERSEKRLDNINATLRFSQKHIQGIKVSFFPVLDVTFLCFYILTVLRQINEQGYKFDMSFIMEEL